MQHLAELQLQFLDVILGGDASRLEEAIIPDGITAVGRLGVYRNNTIITLIDALGDTFAVIKKLLGDEFFNNAAKKFIRTHPPKSPALFEYGHNFPEYLESFPGLAELPYIAHVAKLEWYWNEAFHAQDEKPLAVEGLANIEERDYSRLYFTPHPAFRIIYSPYPIDIIYAANQNDGDSDTIINIDDGDGDAGLALVRPDVDVNFIKFGAGGYMFAEGLVAGLSLEQAITTAEKNDHGFDVTTTLVALLAGGAFSGFSLK